MRTKRYKLVVQHEGKRKHLGYFATEQEREEALKQWRRETMEPITKRRSGSLTIYSWEFDFFNVSSGTKLSGEIHSIRKAAIFVGIQKVKELFSLLTENDELRKIGIDYSREKLIQDLCERFRRAAIWGKIGEEKL